MSLCENCPWEQEMTQDEKNDAIKQSGDTCPEFGCTHEDAAYRAQKAYWRLRRRYEDLLKEREKYLDDGK